MRSAVLVCCVAMLVGCMGGCSDLRDFRGEWTGVRVGDSEALSTGLTGVETPLRLSIDAIDRFGLTGRLAIDGVLAETEIRSLPGAEADALASITFSGSPLRVYLAFAPLAGGDALVIVALFEDRRIDVRLLRGGGSPIYAVFTLHEPGP